MQEHLIEITDLTKIYGTGDIAVRALKGVNAAVEKGDPHRLEPDDRVDPRTELPPLASGAPAGLEDVAEVAPVDAVLVRRPRGRGPRLGRPPPAATGCLEADAIARLQLNA